KEKIKEGLFVNLDHLQEIGRLSHDLSQDTGDYLVFRTLSQICREFCRYWEEEPLTVEDAQLIDTSMRDSMISLIEITDGSGPAIEIMESLNTLVLAYDQCFLSSPKDFGLTRF
ncbi:MAG: hypothetical protein Q8Q15_00800, partial [bacterium]|nr:hypothetical protein [bacterium]